MRRFSICLCLTAACHRAAPPPPAIEPRPDAAPVLVAHATPAPERVRPVLVAGVPKDVVRRAFGGGAWIAYAVDGPDRELITNDTMRRMGKDEAALHELALANLDKALTDLPHKPFTPGSHVFLVKAGDDDESSRMLLPDLWRSAAREVKGRLLAAAPARHIVLFTGSADFNDIATLMSAAKDLAAHEKHPISPTVFEFTGSGWRPAKKLP